MNDIFVGPLEPLLQDPEVIEIMVNSTQGVWVEKIGHGMIETDVKFNNEEEIRLVINSIITPLGRRLDESAPMVDARLPDGSRMNAVIRPISLIGPILTIRKFNKRPLTWDQLMSYGTLTEELRLFLEAAVKAHLNIVVAGGTGSGKTTILNALSEFIADSERIITVETAAELQLRHKHVIPMETRPANIDGKGEVSMQDLIINSSRMRPDRVISGEVRGGEAIDIIQLMNTGYEGSMFTIHANDPRDTLARLETMCLMAGLNIPILNVRRQLATGIDLIVSQQRLSDGSRKIVQVTEVVGIENNMITMHDIFEFEQTGFNQATQRIEGEIRATGVKPTFYNLLQETGVTLPDNLFDAE